MDGLFSPTHWRSSLNNRPLCGGPADARMTQVRGDLECASCLFLLEEARKRRARG